MSALSKAERHSCMLAQEVSPPVGRLPQIGDRRGFLLGSELPALDVACGG